MLEEVGYNPFVSTWDTVPARQKEEGGFGFLEVDSPFDSKRLSFIESKSNSALSSPSLSSNSSPYSSLRNIIVAERRDTQQLDNPFFSDSPPTIEVNGSTALPPSSPLSKSATFYNKPASTLSKSSDKISSSQSQISPSLSSSNLLAIPTNPRNDNAPPVLFTHPSFSSSGTFVVTVDKVDWVPDESSLVCEQCANDFTVIRRRHHCRVCGHLFCGICIVTITLPARLGYIRSQKSCVRCAYRILRARGHHTATVRHPEGLSFSQKLSGRLQNFMYKMAGMRDGGNFDRFAGGLATPLQFSTYPAEVINLKVPSYDSHELPAHAFIPATGEGPFPVLVYLAGGAFVLNEIDASAVMAFCKELCFKIGCIVIAVGHRLAPEHRYPVAWEDCYAAVKWIYEQCKLPKLEKDPKIVVCGEGSGGLLAAAVCHMARDRGGSPPIRYQLLITPWLNLTNLNVDKLEDSYVLTKDLMNWVIQQVFEDNGDREKQYVSPLLAPSVANLPPTKIITAGYDPLRYDGEEYANKLRGERVNASVTRYENSFHGFVGSYVDSYSESEEAIFECVVCLREVFGFGEFPCVQKKETRDSTEKLLEI